MGSWFLNHSYCIFVVFQWLISLKLCLSVSLKISKHHFRISHFSKTLNDSWGILEGFWRDSGGILEGFLAAAHFPIWSASKSLPVIDGCASYTWSHLAFLSSLFFSFLFSYFFLIFCFFNFLFGFLFLFEVCLWCFISLCMCVDLSLYPIFGNYVVVILTAAGS